MANSFISGILKNSYNKIDQERFVRRPSFDDVPATSFFSAKDLILFDNSGNSEGDNSDDVDKNTIIDMIVNDEL